MTKWFCNPLNLEYRYQIKDALTGKGVFREAADPTMLLFRDTYLLFCSMSGGFWYSDDLHSWDFHETPELPIYDYAPDVREINGQVVFSASRRGEACQIFRSPDPLTTPFEVVSAPFDFWDPNLFQDDDGRVYLYWGCSSKEPLYGIELDPENLLPIGDKTVLFGENEAAHGWERKGENNHMPPPKKPRDFMIRLAVGTKPFIEGAYMNKVNGQYYLQYAAPGTECNVYADGVYLADTPLGPFRYQDHNPFSSVPGGFAQGAGHGSTFQDKAGNWWHVTTMRISVNENFERRIGLFPCDFDADGNLYCNQNFACYPQSLPLGRREDMDRITPAMQLLSINAAASASSSQPANPPSLGVDEDIRTCWAAKRDDNSPWYQLDLGTAKTVQAVQINFADHKLPMQPLDKKASHKDTVGYRIIQTSPQQTCYLLEGSLDGEHWTLLRDTRAAGTDYTHDFFVLDEPQSLRYLRVRDIVLAMGGISAISGLRVFGIGDEESPRQVADIEVARSADGLNLYLNWSAAPGAQGYNIRYGIAADKLYNSWQIWDRLSLDLSLINAGQSYCLAIDSFNENVVTPGKIISIN